MQHCAEGRYFEVLVEEVCKSKSTRAIAVGVACLLNQSALVHGRIRAKEARELERVWLAGYEKAGALFVSDGKESKIPTKAWRPVTEVKAGTRLGVLWLEPQQHDSESSLVIFHDGEERLRLPACGRLPGYHEDLFALVDLQGSVQRVTLVEGASPPKQMQETPDSKMQRSSQAFQAGPREGGA